jgi:dipeptidyl aminopeptidase/acylaminoacyl peptidase
MHQSVARGAGWVVAAAVAGGSAAWAQEATPLIPRATLFGNPDRANVQLSPDGKWISFLAPVDGVINVWVAPADKPGDARAVTRDTNRGVRQYFWAFDNTHLLYMQDLGGDENWKIFSVPAAGGEARDLTPFEDIKGPDGKPIMLPSGKPLRPAARIEAVSPDFPGTILVGLNSRDPRLHDAYKLEIATGAMKLVQQNDGFVGFAFDDSFTPRFAYQPRPDGGMEIMKADGKGGFAPWQSVPMEDSLTTQISGFTKDRSAVYMVDSRGSNTARLTRVDAATGEATVLASDERADAGSALVHPTEKTVQAVEFEYDRSEWKVLDQAVKTDLDYLRSVNPGEVAVQSRTLDDSRWLVSFMQDDGPVKYYRYDRTPGKAGTATYLFSNRSKLEGLGLAKMHPVVIKSRDGLNLVSYLTLPRGSDGKRAGRPGSPLPMVLLVHGGPWARDGWGYNSMHQWLANRGYAVLSVNFRGSTGLGKAFLNAGNREWAGKMHDDLIDAVNWAVREGIAEKSRVAIMGGSYGGYATLTGLTFTPEVFACGVDIVGPSNIVTLLNTIPPHWAPMIEQFTQRVGDHRTEEGRKFLTERSPISRVDRIVRPLLIGQGANDPRVKQSESDQIVSAMQGKSIPVTYVLFPDEGHGFQRPENGMAFNAIVEAFLAQHLGGRHEPIGQDVARSTAEVRAGAEGVPGLPEAIAATDVMPTK